MRGVAISIMASLGLHAAGAAWLLSAAAPEGSPGAGDAAQTVTARLGGAEIAALVETWQTAPDPAPTPAALKAPSEDSALIAAPLLKHRAMAPMPRMAALPQLAETPPMRPALPVASQPVQPVMIDAGLKTIPRADAPVEIDPPAATVMAGAVSVATMPGLELAPVAPAHPGPSVMASPAPVPRPDRAAPQAIAPERPRRVAAASAAQTPARASTQEAPGARDAWGSAIRRSIAQHHQVPSSALRRGLSGRVVLRITVTPQGAVAGVQLRASSGHDILDKAALATLRRAGAMPRAPSGVRGPMTFDVPLSYRSS